MDQATVGLGIDRLPRQDHEARRVVRLVLDVRLEDREPVGLGCKPRGDRGAGRIAGRRHLGCGACGIGVHDRQQPQPVDELPALRERVHMRVRGLEPRRVGTGAGEQIVADPLEMLGDDMEVGLGQELVDVGHAACRRVLDRDHREPRAAVRDRGEGIAEGLAGERGHCRIAGHAGGLGIGAGRALERDYGGRIPGSIGAIA